MIRAWRSTAFWWDLCLLAPWALGACVLGGSLTRTAFDLASDQLLMGGVTLTCLLALTCVLGSMLLFFVGIVRDPEATMGRIALADYFLFGVNLFLAVCLIAF